MPYEPRVQDQPRLDERFILHLPVVMKRELLQKAERSRRSAADLVREGISHVLEVAA